MRPELNWTHYRILISIKNENERNYYINLAILNNLSSRELQNEIKNKSFDRLSYADKEHIELISDNTNTQLSIKDMVKDSIILVSDKTIGLLIVKKKNNFVIEYTTSGDILITTYALN